MITSLSNERVKQVRALQAQRRARHKAGLFVLEGLRLIQEAVRAGVPVQEVFYTEDFAQRPDGLTLLEGLSAQGAACMAVSPPVMEAMSDTQTPQGVLAVLPAPALPIPEEPTFVLIVDRVTDPGNLGAVLRTAAAAAVPLVFLTAGTVDETNPKVVRGGMGAHFHLPMQHLSWAGIASRVADRAVFLAESSGGAPHYRVDWTQPCALIISGEAYGASDDAIRLAHARVTIPMPGSAESLNVAIAAGILLFEMARQRTQEWQGA
jgi:TrmH family RNA methyltransferase